MMRLMKALCVMLLLGLSTSGANAAVAVAKPIPVAASSAEPTTAPHAALIDADSGQILYAKDADVPIAPASMSKMMTMYLVFEALRDGRLNLDQRVRISREAWTQTGSRMFVQVDTEVAVSDLIKGAIIHSGNDACTALAEAVAGNVPQFVALMNKKAAELGLKQSHFMNPTGLPDPQHKMSAHDLAFLANRLINDFPENYKIYATRTFTFNNITQPNRNPLLGNYPDADGVKTGHTDDAGYCLVGSTKRNGRRLIAVVTGLPNDRARAKEASALLDYGFREYRSLIIEKLDLHIPVTIGTVDTLQPVLQQPLQVSIAKNAQHAFKLQAIFDNTIHGALPAPIAAKSVIGRLQIVDASDTIIAQVPLLSPQTIERGGWWSHVRYLLGS